MKLKKRWHKRDGERERRGNRERERERERGNTADERAAGAKNGRLRSTQMAKVSGCFQPMQLMPK